MRSRREMLGTIEASAAALLGGRLLSSDSFPIDSNPRTTVAYPEAPLIDPSTDEVVELDRDDGESVDGATAGPLLHRTWNPATGRTASVDELSPRADLDPLDHDADVIGSLYREHDDALAYVNDTRVSGSILEDAVPAPSEPTDTDRFERTITPQGVEVEYAVEEPVGVRTTLTVPYASYLPRASSGGLRHRLALLPVAGDSGFDVDRHHRLVEVFKDIDVGDVGPDPRVAAIAAFVQSIPHETDWESKRRLNYLRSPEEALVELTADCKDASLLLYHLLDEHGFDPVFVFLDGDAVGDVVGGLSPFSSSDRAKEEKSADEKKAPDGGVSVVYPNHLAVALPVDEIDPHGAGVVEETAIMSRDGTGYAYVESTSRQPPGTYWDAHADKTPYLYETRRELLSKAIA